MSTNKIRALARLRAQRFPWQPDPAQQIDALAPILPLTELREHVGLFLGEDTSRRLVHRRTQAALMVLPYAIQRYHRREMRRCDPCPECQVTRTYASLCLACDTARMDMG